MLEEYAAISASASTLVAPGLQHRNQVDRCKVVTQTFASWNQIGPWLRTRFDSFAAQLSLA
jgi:hypothetical protein